MILFFMIWISEGIDQGKRLPETGPMSGIFRKEAAKKEAAKKKMLIRNEGE